MRVQVRAKLAAGRGSRLLLLARPCLFSLPLNFPPSAAPGAVVIAHPLREQSALLCCLRES